MDDSSKLTRAQRQQIIFKHLKGTPDPLYDVVETKHGKYIVKPKQIEVEEEMVNEEPEETISEESNEEEEEVRQVKPSKQANKHRTKQDARRLLDALTSLINSSESSDEDEDYQSQRAPPIIEPNNYNPRPQLSFRRRRLIF